MPAVGAAVSRLNPTGVTGGYTARPYDLVVADAGTANLTVTLPAGAATGTLVAVKKDDPGTNAVTVTAASGTVNGAGTYALLSLGAGATFQFDGTNWLLLSTAANTSLQLPGGGSTLQVLGKAASTDNGNAWFAATALAGTSFGPTWRSGYYFDNRINALAATGTVSMPASTQYYVPFFVPTAVGISAIAAHVATANAFVTLGMGIYAPAATGMPGALLLATVSGAASAAGALEKAYAVTLPQGWNYFGLGNPSGSTLSLSAIPVGAAFSPLGTVAAPAAGAGAPTYISVSSGGNLPNPAANGNTQVTGPPWVFIKPA